MAAAGLSYPVRHPAWVLTYSGQNITADITSMVIEISYSDTSGAHTHGRGRKAAHETDEVEVTLEDRDRRWQGPWFPVRGDIVTLQMGYDGEEFLDCGDFQVDELELKGPPDTFHLKCIAAGITPSLRSPRSVAYESTTLDQVANTVASRNGLTVLNAPQNVSVQWQRITQREETDLHFLRRLALAHNYDFTIRGTQLIFYVRSALEQQAPIATIERTQTKTFEFRTKTQQIYRSATVAYQNPAQKQLIAAQYGDTTSPTGDDLHIVARCETPDQATLKAQSALHDANMMEVTGHLETEGDIFLVAGVNITIQGFRSFDGNYQVTASHHRLDRGSGYTTEIEVRQL
jgi:phage protein D